MRLVVPPDSRTQTSSRADRAPPAQRLGRRSEPGPGSGWSPATTRERMRRGPRGGRNHQPARGLGPRAQLSTAARAMGLGGLAQGQDPSLVPRVPRIRPRTAGMPSAGAGLTASVATV